MAGWRSAKRWGSMLSIAAFAGQAAGTGPSASTLLVGQEQTPLHMVDDRALTPRLHELTLTTPALATPAGLILGANPSGQTKVRILLPRDYRANGNQRYPVLYLFHGGTEDFAAWTSPAGRGDAERLTENAHLIVVMPDGGQAGGYADWFNAGKGRAPKWRTYHLNQLIPWIDAHFRTIADRRARATAGLSMGGGGLRYAAQRPDLIGATAAFPGDIDITQPASDWRGMGAPISKLIWGDYAAEQVRWRGVNGPDLAANLGNTDVSLFVGDTGRPEATYILPGTTHLHERLKQFGIDHRFTVYPGFTHSWQNWNRALSEWMPHLMEYFAAGAGSTSVSADDRPVKKNDPSQHFTFSTIEPNYSLYGWTVEMRRAALEFSSLLVTAAYRFSVIGSGSARVVLPSSGLAGVPFRISIQLPRSSKSIDVVSGSDGRIPIDIDLGPANRFQQYSRDADAIATAAPEDQTPFELANNGSRFFRADVTVRATSRGLCDASKTLRSLARGDVCPLFQQIALAHAHGHSAARPLASLRSQLRAADAGPRADAIVRWSETL